MKHIAIVHIATAEWEAMWERLKARFGDYDCWCPDTAEGWQYMGSSLKLGRLWLHSFRHRSLPPEGERTYWECAATAGWKPEETHEFNDSHECPF